MALKTIDLRTAETIANVHPRKAERRLRMPSARWLLLLASVIVFATGVYLATNWSKLHSSADVNDVGEIKIKVSRHYLLPTNEMPALATVTDASKLNTPFLKQAHTGDKILIYQTNKFALIYRPSLDRVVAVGPVSIAPAPTNLPAPIVP